MVQTLRDTLGEGEASTMLMFSMRLWHFSADCPGSTCGPATTDVVLSSSRDGGEHCAGLSLSLSLSLSRFSRQPVLPLSL